MVLVLPLTPPALDATFHRSRWTAHLTVLSNFTTSLMPGDVLDRLKPAIRSAEPVRGIVGEDAQFGPDGSVRVQLIHSPAAEALHTILVDALHEVVTLEAPGFARTGFRPHVTVGREHELRPGDSLTLPEITLADLRDEIAHVSWTQKLGQA